jgi:hypothetical protein
VGVGARFVEAQVPVPSEPEHGQVETTVGEQHLIAPTLLIEIFGLGVQPFDRGGWGGEQRQQIAAQHLVASAWVARGQPELVEEKHRRA